MGFVLLLALVFLAAPARAGEGPYCIPTKSLDGATMCPQWDPSRVTLWRADWLVLTGGHDGRPPGYAATFEATALEDYPSGPIDEWWSYLSNACSLRRDEMQERLLQAWQRPHPLRAWVYNCYIKGLIPGDDSTQLPPSGAGFWIFLGPSYISELYEPITDFLPRPYYKQGLIGAHAD